MPRCSSSVIEWLILFNSKDFQPSHGITRLQVETPAILRVAVHLHNAGGATLGLAIRTNILVPVHQSLCVAASTAAARVDIWANAYWGQQPAFSAAVNLRPDSNAFYRFTSAMFRTGSAFDIFRGRT